MYHKTKQRNNFIKNLQEKKLLYFYNLTPFINYQLITAYNGQYTHLQSRNSLALVLFTMAISMIGSFG